MRTVTFSDERVVNFVNRNFVAVWKNIRPAERFRDGIYEDERGDTLVAKLPEGTGDDNICAHLATPDGKIVHAVQGLAREARFLEELKFAVSIAELAPEKLKEAYAKRKGECKEKGSYDMGAALLKRNLERLGRDPLPSLDTLLKSQSAGLGR